VAKGDNKNSLGSAAITPVDLRLCHRANVLPSASGSANWAHVLPSASGSAIGLTFCQLGSRSAIGLMFCHGQLVGVMYCTVLYDLFRFSIQVLNFILIFNFYFSNFHFGSEKNNNFMNFFWGNK